MTPLEKFHTKRDLFSIAFFITALVYYFVTPLTGDIFVFFGSAHLADIQYDGGAWGAIQSWELKPFANRIFIYYIYKLTLLFVDFEAKAEFIIVAKSLYSFLIILASFALSSVFKQLKEYKFKISFKNSFFVFSGLLFLSSFRVILQAEFTALLFSFFALFFVLSSRRFFYGIGIILLSLIPFFKGISVIFTVQIVGVLFGFFQWNKRQIIKVSLLSATVALLIAVSIYAIYPQEFTDIKEATLFQSSFGLGFLSIIHSIFKSTIYSVTVGTHFPLLLISLLGMLFWFIKKRLKSFSDRSFLSLLVIWLVGYLAIIIQQRFFVYHFVNLTIPIMFSMLLVIRLFQLNLSYKKVTITIAGLFSLLFLLDTSPLQHLLPLKSVSIGNASHWDYLSMRRQINSFNKLTEAKPTDIDTNKTILYLDNGTGIWCLGAKSASRYYYPLPVQRYRYNSDLSKTKCYKKVLNKMNNFNGKYILMAEGWFIIPSSPDFNAFRKKMEGYERLKGLSIYKKKDI